ncbi:MAG: CHASE2 domain-containing protein, partial [Solirubrobacteraceae bacterium]
MALAMAADVTGLLARPEQDSVALRFQLRGEEPVDDVAVVAIDDITFSDLERGWPFPRSLHGRAVDALREGGGRSTFSGIPFPPQNQTRGEPVMF